MHLSVQSKGAKRCCLKVPLKARDRDGAGTVSSSSDVPADVAVVVMALTATELAVAVAVSGLPLRRQMTDAEFYSVAADGVRRVGLWHVRNLADDVDGCDALLSAKYVTRQDHIVFLRESFGSEGRWSLAACLANRGGVVYPEALASAFAPAVARRCLLAVAA